MLEEVWEKNQTVLRSIIRNLINNPSKVDDILHDSLTQVLRSNKTFPNKKEAYNYLRRAVVNTTIDYYRREKRWFGVEKELAKANKSPADPQSRLLEKERRQTRSNVLKEVDQVIVDLPQKQRQAIELIFFRADIKLKEICLQESIPYSTLRSRMLVALDQIRVRLSEKGLYRHYQYLNRD